ncbi:unnamed protein product, partial [Brassica oleracea]
KQAKNDSTWRGDLHQETLSGFVAEIETIKILISSLTRLHNLNEET